MRRETVILLTLGAGAALLYAGRSIAQSLGLVAAEENFIPWLSPPSPASVTQEETMVSNNAASPEQRVSAFLALVRKFESDSRYNVLYGGTTFDDYSQHPNIRVPFHNPKTGKDDYSTAAGAYQITYPTWRDEILPALDLAAFEPADQDAGALYLLKVTGAYDAILAGDIDSALRHASRKWASLPYSSAQQHPQALQAALDTFTEFLASIG